MTKPKQQYKTGERILHEAGDNTRFDQKFAEEVAEEIARKLFGLWDWRGALQEVHAPSGLQALINHWLHTQVPVLAYAYVTESGAPGQMSKYMPRSSHTERK
jgi:hypothetical protein